MAQVANTTRHPSDCYNCFGAEYIIERNGPESEKMPCFRYDPMTEDELNGW